MNTQERIKMVMVACAVRGKNCCRVACPIVQSNAPPSAIALNSFTSPIQASTHNAPKLITSLLSSISAAHATTIFFILLLPFCLNFAVRDYQRRCCFLSFFHSPCLFFFGQDRSANSVISILALNNFWFAINNFLTFHRSTPLSAIFQLIQSLFVRMSVLQSV